MTEGQILNWMVVYESWTFLILACLLLLNAVPFLGLFLPDEIILTLSFSLTPSWWGKLILAVVAFSAILIGQTVVYFLAKKYGLGIISKLKVPESQYQRFNRIYQQANFFDHVLIRLSPTSLFQTMAAVLTGISGQSLSRHLLYESVSISLRILIYGTVGSLFSNPDNLSELVTNLTLIVVLVAVLGLALSYLLKKKLN